MNATATKIYCRQGDVGLLLIPAPKGDFKEQQRDSSRGVHVLVKSVATSHSHLIASKHAKVLRDPKTQDAVLFAEEDCNLEHDATDDGPHGAIPVPAGTYLIRIQRQWTGSTSQAVED